MERNFLSDFRQLSSTKKKFLKPLLAALLVVHVAKTVVRNTDWRDELSIFKVRGCIDIFGNEKDMLFISKSHNCFTTR